MFPERLTGDGFTLRLLAPADVPALEAFLNLPEVVEPTSSAGWSRQEIEQFAAEAGPNAFAGAWCRYGVVPVGERSLVGTVGLFHVDSRNQRAELGYELAPSAWGKGLMTRTAGLLVDWAFAHEFHRIEATVMAGHHRSERVLERLRFQREATMRDYKLVRGAYRDFSLWARLAGD